eukprot:1138969-Pelagomonas_calceolata.AAC.9
MNTTPHLVFLQPLGRPAKRGVRQHDGVCAAQLQGSFRIGFSTGLSCGAFLSGKEEWIPFQGTVLTSRQVLMKG